LYAFVFALGLLLPCNNSSPARTDIELRPDMPAIAMSLPATPLLNAPLPDADITPNSGEITPQIPYRWITLPDGTLDLHVRVAAGSGVDRAVFTVWNWENISIHQETLNCPKEADYRVHLHGSGGYLLTLDGYSGGATCRWRRVRSIAACLSNKGRRQQWNSSPFQVGICTFPGRQSWPNDYGPANPPGLTPEQSWRLDAELTARTGVQIVRPDIPGTGQEGDTAWIDTTLLDAYTKLCRENGIQLDLQIGAPPPVLEKYAAVKDPQWRYPRAEAPYRRYVHTLVTRYGKDAKFIEVWNEPDNTDFWRGTPEEFITQHRWAYEEIRAVDPHIPIAPGGYCMMKMEWTPLMAGPLGKMTDWLTYHSHGDVTALRKMLTDIRRITTEAGAAKSDVVNTEMGWAAWRLDMERMQAVTGMQKLLECWAEGHRAALLYCARDIGGPRQRKDPDWGYLDYTFCPRFAYAALTAFIDTYTGARFVKPLLKHGDITAYQFVRGSEILVSLSGPEAKRNVMITGVWRSATLIDPMGNQTPLKGDQAFTVGAGSYPVTVVLEAGKDIAVTPQP